MEKYFEINREGQNIRCKLYCEKAQPIRQAVLFVHGFAGHKDNLSAQKFADRLLTKYKGIALVTFDLPCHGDDVKKKLTLEDCLTYLGLVLDHIRDTLHVPSVFAYAASFGGYLTLLYIARHGNPFEKIALRCPAVNMHEVLTRSIMKHGEYELVMKGKAVRAGFDRTIEVDRQFLEALEAADIRKSDYSAFMDEILILHGTADEVVPFEESLTFADGNLIELIPVQRADHRFQGPGCAETATKAVLSFFFP